MDLLLLAQVPFFVTSLDLPRLLGVLGLVHIVRLGFGSLWLQEDAGLGLLVTNLAGDGELDARQLDADAISDIGLLLVGNLVLLGVTGFFLGTFWEFSLQKGGLLMEERHASLDDLDCKNDFSHL